MKKILLAICAVVMAASCSQKPVQQPLENSVVYEMNVRQYTPEGTFNHPYDNKKWDNEGERVVPNLIVAY